MLLFKKKLFINRIIIQNKINNNNDNNHKNNINNNMDMKNPMNKANNNRFNKRDYYKIKIKNNLMSFNSKKNLKVFNH